MNKKMMVVLPCVCMILLIWVLPNFGNQYLAKLDNNIVSLDLHTGALLWRNKEHNISQATFKLFHEGLVAQLDRQSKQTHPTDIFLNPKSGKNICSFDTDKAHLLASYNRPKHDQLENGWKLKDFRPGYSTKVQFADPKTGKVVWEIPNLNYPTEVWCWKNLALFSFSSAGVRTGQARLYAYEAGASKKKWVVIPDWILHGQGWAELRQMTFDIIDDVIYIDANEHIFSVDPETGRVLFHKDLSHDLNLKYHPELEGDPWMFSLVHFAKSQDVLLISFNKRLIAFDLKTNRYLWTFEPDVFPSQPKPLVYEGTIFTIAGAKSHLVQFSNQIPIGTN
jgi:outer membrane protein assembly factor BamB